jgi:hypothetical protein
MYEQYHQNALAASREYAERFPEREIDRTGLKILEKNIKTYNQLSPLIQTFY